MILRCVLVAIALTLPGSLSAGVAHTYDVDALPSTGVISKVAIDAIAHGTGPAGVWLATGRGLNYSFDAGLSWFGYNVSNGLPSENLSAIFSVNGRIWVASSHDEFLEGQLYSLSDGLTYSDNNGADWTTLDFSSDGLNIPRVIGGDRVIYDITGHTDIGFFEGIAPATDTTGWLFASAFAGGLLASQDGGLAWRRIYSSPSDSIQFNLTSEAPSLRNRYFSCAIDTTHGDSIFLWTGTASGIFQYVYVPPRNKLYSRWITSLAICDTCSGDAGSRLYVGGQSGVTLAALGERPSGTRFEADGLTGEFVTALYGLGDYLLVGTFDTTGGDYGLSISSDFGESYSEVVVPEIASSGGSVSGFAYFQNRLYLAGGQAGLMVSNDSGQTWAPVPFDTLYPGDAVGVVRAVSYLEDTLLLGTDSGLVELTLDPGGVIQTGTHTPFLDTDSTGASIIRIRAQFFENDSTMVLDSVALWTVHRPLTGGGISMVGRRGWDHSWRSLRRAVRTHDVNFFGDSAFTVGDLGIWFTPRGLDPTNFFSARQYVNDTIVVASLDNDTVTAMEVRGDTVIFGCSNGYAVSHNGGESFRIYRANLDSLAADLVINHTYITSIFGLAGDFVPALCVQPMASGPARVWAGTRPAEFGGQGISVGMFDPVGGNLVWQAVHDDFAWNFEFADSMAFAATNSGLLVNYGTLDSLDTEWTTVPFENELTGEVLVAPGTAAYGVGLVDSFLWVGTDDGIVRLKISDFGDQELFQRVDSTTSPDEVYAFPVPFSPQRGGIVDFHFVVDEPGNVTLEVYDFAMNLVGRPIDNVFYPAGIYPAQGSQGITWDGRNGKGDVVAVGVYYFKVELPSGEARWGKLAVIP